MDYTNKTVLVTGGSSGIGEAVLKEFAKKQPGRLFSFDIKDPEERIPKVNYAIVDISDGHALLEAVSKIPKHPNYIDFVVNSAGVKEEETPEGIERMFQVNVKGTSNLLHILRINFESNSIFVQISSERALKLNEFIGYSSSKLAGALVAKSFAESVWNYRGAIKIVYPGPVDTPLFRRGKSEERINKIQPTKPEDLAKKIIELIESNKKVLRCLDDFPNWTYVLE